MALKKQTITKLEDIHNITVLMFGLLGDVFIRTPILKALKELYPQAKITVAVDAVGVFVVKNNPYCDDIIVVDRSKKSRVSYYINKIKTILAVRKSRADLVIDLYNGGSSPFITLSSSAKYRLGYAHQKDRRFYNLTSEYVPYEENVIEPYNKQIISILQAISGREFSINPIYYIGKDSTKSVQDYLATLDVDLSKLYLLNLGSGGEEKLLENRLYFELIKHIYKAYGFYPAIIKNPGQEYLQESLISEYLVSSSLPFVTLKALSIDEIAALIDTTKFIITPDTGLMHLAFALDAYVLTPFTYTNPKLVDLASKKFFPIYEGFGAGEIHKQQNITFEMMRDIVDRMFIEMQEEFK